MKSLLVKYILREDKHVDPNFTYLTYGDSGQKGTQIVNNIEAGSYVFFHTSYNGKAYITAYFYIEKVLTKENNPAEINSLHTDSKVDEVVILGNRDRSKILTYPLPFDKDLATKLKTLNIEEDRFNSEQTELKVISDATRTHRVLFEEEVEYLLGECLDRG